jgi:hypothetical protein
MLNNEDALSNVQIQNDNKNMGAKRFERIEACRELNGWSRVKMFSLVNKANTPVCF